jgi:hydroxymethylpyrimidine kinase / phosphomethylpyrimidine kinase / thiamine-phosphate diphosphorylase
MNGTRRPLRLVVNNESPGTSLRGLYLVTDQEDRLPERVREALSGGVSALQFRHKGPELRERLDLGWELKAICADFRVPFIVNDDVELALELDADGLHLGQEDGGIAEARRLLGSKKIIGVSTHDLREALRAEEEGADYIGFGAMYPTRSKDVIHLPGPERLAEVRKSVTIPIVAIGGISPANACAVIDAGADAVAVISAVLSAPKPAVAAAELSLLFNRRLPLPRGTVMTVAGSDSGGGAGIQGDIKTIALLGSYAASAITALTAQNTRGVAAIHPVPASFVAEQMEAVLSDIHIDVIKTGMLPSAGIVDAVAEKLRETGRRIVVVDPVMIAKGGASLSGGDAVAAMKESLIPLTYLLTPNVPEAEALTGTTVSDVEGMERAARLLHGMGAKNVLVKGGHLPEGEAVDILFDGSTFTRFSRPRQLTRNTHGTGCTLASAIAAFLGQGIPLHEAVDRGKEFITAAIRHAQPMGKGHGPVNHWQAAREAAGDEREKP